MLKWEVRQFTSKKNTAYSRPNQDAKYVGKNGIFILADGVGGVHGGKLASESAVLQTRLKLEEMLRLLEGGFAYRRDIKSRLTDYVNMVHGNLRAMPREAGASSGIETTLDLCFVYGGIAYTAHVGDSRIYHLRKGSLKQLTKDDEIYLGMESRKDEGSKERIDVSLRRTVLADLDVLAMLTDGVTRYSTRDELKAHLQNFDSEHNVAQKIVFGARNPEGAAKLYASKRGVDYVEALKELRAKDDETAIVIKFRGSKNGQ